MPEFNDLFDDDAEIQGTDLVKQLRAALKNANKELKEVREAQALVTAEQRTRSLADVFKEKGLSEKAAGLYPGDRDATADAVAEWLSDYGEVFGIEQQKPATTASPEQVQAAQVLSSVTAQAPSTQTAHDVNALIAEIQAATTPAELAAAYEKAGLK